uniref:Choline O-acetyltransferase n=1 Tax=Setaria digitata TaxID=48799 RepID=A0A915PTV8_9BILA
MYLKVRFPLPINSNPAYIFPQQIFNTLDEQLSYASWLIRGFCDYKDMIDRKLITREVSTGRHKVHICMEQYDRILRSYREPCTPVDIQHYRMIANDNLGVNWNEHILAMCNNQTFIVFTRLDGVLLSQAEIAKQLEMVVKMSRSGKTKYIGIAGGSVGDRDDAAKFWNIMTEDFGENIKEHLDKQNYESLNWIKTASFGICIDIHDETKWSENYERNLAHRGLHLLHGFGSRMMGLNRWYDMTIQCDSAKKDITPLELQWTILSHAKPFLQKQIKVFDELHGHLVSTYESASIRRFRSGRVDNIRAATPEALRWVQAMLDKDKSQIDKRKLFEEAVKKQTEITLENITGHGIDNHLCALQLLAKKEVSEGLLPRMPDLFLDPIWTETMRFPLSTSQVTTSSSITDTYLCYGPVVKDGYGCSYNIQPNLIIFAPSSFKSCPVTNAEKFKKSLIDSLSDIKALIT